jgi:hypothetical protein
MHPANNGITFFSSLRNRFQLALFALTLAIGAQFIPFVEQAGIGGILPSGGHGHFDLCRH